MIVPANAKYKIIQETVALHGNLLNVSVLCKTAGVSISGYYHYLTTDCHIHTQQGLFDIVDAVKYRQTFIEAIHT